MSHARAAPGQSADERAAGAEVLLLFSDAGGGHRNAANALIAAAEQQARPLRLRMLSLAAMLNHLDVVRLLTGRSTEETYNELLRRGRTRFLVPLLRLLHGATALLHRPLVRAAAGALRALEPRPDLVVSLHPNFNAVLRDAVRRALPGVPFMVLMTDFADFPPHFWIESGLDRLIVGSARAEAQALELGLAPEQIRRHSGMLLHPRFYAAGGLGARARTRAELGIPADAFVVTVLFGGKGSAEMEPLSRGLLEAAPDLHVIALCGKNPALVARFDALRPHAGGRLHHLGFTERVADFMAACDVLAAKPGPGVLAEAFQQRVPVIVACNHCTIPQERYNAEMLQAQGLGLVVSAWEQMPAAVRALRADAAERARLAERLGALPPNRAVYEALDAIEAEVFRAAELAGRRP